MVIGIPAFNPLPAQENFPSANSLPDCLLYFSLLPPVGEISYNGNDRIPISVFRSTSPAGEDSLSYAQSIQRIPFQSTSPAGEDSAKIYNPIHQVSLPLCIIDKFTFLVLIFQQDCISFLHFSTLLSGANVSGKICPLDFRTDFPLVPP